jgi:Amt family ammonium transporter
MSGVGLASGAVAGLVAITPAAGFVAPSSALLLGGLGGGVCLLAVRLRGRTGVDDALDVFAIHGVAGILGALMTGLLCTPAVNPAAPQGGLHQLLVQAAGVGVTLAWTAVGSLALLHTVGRFLRLRAHEEDEALGLDLAEAGERAYGTGERPEPVHAAPAEPLLRPAEAEST